jgi:hypothetical protein
MFCISHHISYFRIKKINPTIQNDLHINAYLEIKFYIFKKNLLFFLGVENHYY